MNIIDRIKSFLGFGKGGDSMDMTADITKLETAASKYMQTATALWWEAFQRRLPQKPTHENFRPIAMAYTSTSAMAQLVTSELKFQLADEALNGFAQANLIPSLDKISQLTLAGGYTVNKPFYCFYKRSE